MTIANEKMQMRLTALMEQALTCDCCSAEIKAQAQKWLDNRNDAVATREVYETIVPLCAACECDVCKGIVTLKGFIVKRSQWIIAGDGAAYDIGFGGLDHVLASGKNVNILVLDTEVYSNTGGQASKATPITPPQERPRSDRHHLRLRLRRTGSDGRRPGPDPQGNP